MATEIVDVLLRARMEASGVEAGVGQIQKSLKGLTLPKGISDNLEKSFSKLTPLLKDYQKQLNKGFSNKKDLQNFNALKEKISETFSEIRSQVQSVNSQNVRLKVDTQEIDKLENKITAKTADLQKALSNVFTKSINTNNIKEQLDKVIDNTTKAATVKPMADAAKKLFNAQDYAAYNNKIDELKNKILSLKTTKVDLATALGVKDAATNLDLANDKVEKFFNSLKVNEGKVQTIEHLKQELKDLGINLENVKLDSLTKGANELQSIDSLIDQLAGSLRETGNAAGDAGQGMVRMVDEVNELKSSTQYFFSLRNMINLLKRGIDEAVQSVKDLDKAMTETAVVTDFSVADMWKDLPKYTQIANELGATTQGAYETMTLYYQQGLDQQQAFALGAETMKMARIAGLDYAETTDMMTAALRGFNMELNETSAKRVNDVYSELAAITASDTEELGTAMQRTASIAASAGASFEGTTAFLAQAIETTREPAENIGTAMKTIVARFQEMKKNPLEISEVDGEEVDYNKIDAALKTIGVDLKDTNGQFREFDQVMLDISARWDGLSQAQQRYIATTAAGSRQQSRFIAMVSNYDRTMQLMEAANNSAGASDEQFGKTMDSLEAKLNKLHNAWQRFTMGIMNNNMVKGIVDAGTTILTIVNKIIDVLSFNGQSGLIKSLLSLTTAFTALKGGGKIINSLIGGLGGLVDPQSSFKEGLKGGFLGGRNQLQADRISNPIVKAIYSLIPHIDKSVVQNSQLSKYQGPGDYKAAREQLKTSGFLRKGNGISLRNISDIFDTHQLNKEQQAAFLKASPGLRSMLSKQLGKIYEQAGASPETKRGMVAGFKKGAITLKDALAHEDLHESFSDMMSRAEKSGSESQMAKAAAIRDKYSKQFQKEAIEKGVDVNDYLRKSFANLKVPKEGVEELMAALNERSPMEKFQDGLGQIGAGLMSAGSTLQMFGSTLSETNPILGQFVSSLGNTLTTMGSLVNTIPALMNPWTLAIGAIGAAVALEQKRIGDIKNAAEEVSKSFEETNKTTQENIASLKSYQSELATLSKGVDINGNNVSLSGAEYERYLEIVDEIATLNPEIVQGYNAQGHAIINNNKALDETIAKQEELQKKSLNNYIESDSLQKLIDARNINGTFRGATSKIVEDKKASKWQEDQGLAGTTKVQTAPMTVATQKVLAEMQKQKGLDIDSILQGYGISLEQLQAGEEKAVNTFVKNQDQINAQVGAAIATSGEEINESLTESFDKLSEQTANFDAAVAPVLQNLQTYVSNTPAFKNIGPEFQSALMSGLKDIVIQPDLDAKEMQEQARVLVQEFDNLSAEGSDYANAMKEVEAAQDQFAESLDASEYTKNTEKALQTLDSLMSHYAGKTDAYSQAIAEYLQTQMDQIRDFTTDSGVSLSHAFNGVSDTLAAAEGAYNSFQESTKTDLATGKDSMKSIFDEITKETDGVALHMEKFGDGTMWKGARALLGDKFVEENAENVEVIKEAIRSLEPELKAGEEGFAAFWNNFSQVDDSKIKGFTWNEDGSYDIDRNLNPEVYEQIADAMHRSEEYVVAMLNAGKQFADIDFHEVADVRKAFATDNATIKSGDQIFVKSDYYDNALDEANIFNPNERRNIKAQDKAAGIIEIKNPDQITKKDFQSMGISNLPSLIQTFGDTGVFNRDEILEYAEALGNSGLIDYNPEDFESEYQHYLDAQEHPELQPIESIESTVQRIAGLIDKNNILEGHYSKEDEDTAQALYDSVIGEEGKNDTATQYFGEGKNEAGNRLLSPKEFIDSYANLGKIAAEAEEKANTYYQGAEEAERNGDSETADKLRHVGDLYDAVQKSTLANQQEGKQNWVDEYARQAYESKLQELENSGLDDAAIKAEAAKVWQEAFDAAQATVNTAEGKENTNQEIHQAVQEQAQALSQSNASNEEIKASMIEAANKMAEAQMKPGEIASELNKAYGTNLTDKDVNLGEQGVELTLDESKLQEQLSNLHADVEANITGINMGGHAARASGQNNPNSMFHRHGTMARGSRRGYIIPGRPTLTGEEGEELVWEPKRNEAYMVGSNGPQFANISKDAIVWNAAQTKRIKKNSKTGNFGTGAKGISRFGTMANGSGGLKIPGVLDVDAKATIQDVTVPEKELTIPVKAELKKKTTIDDVDAIATITQVIKNGQVAGEPVMVQATATTTKVKNETPAPKVSAEAQTIKVTANTSAAQAKINQLIQLFNKTYTLKYKASGPSSIRVPISANFIGPWKKSVEINRSGAQGINNYIRHYSTPSFGSAAKGRFGTIGPKDNGGLTLTGEKGFEIAWLPSENRSMILGANGPQMLQLPSDAVVYTHEQSKKILKQKSILAGSMDRGSYQPDTNSGDGNGGGGGGNNNPKSKKTAADKTLQKQIQQVTAEAGHVVVWWENMARRVESVQRQAEKNQKKLEGLLTKITSTTKTVNGTVKNYQKNLKTSIALSQREVLRANRELRALDTGSNKYYSQEDVSYEEKVNGEKKSHDITINLDRYIKYNKLFKNYDIDWKLLEQIGTWGWYDSSGNKHAANKSLAEAIKAAAEKAINDRVSKRNTAEDNVTKAREELEKLSKDIYDTFYGWETSLTKIWNITQKIEALTTKISRLDAGTSLLEAQIGSGMRISDASSAQTDIQLFKQRLNLQNRTLLERQDAITQATQDVKDAISVTDENTEITTINDMLKNPKKYKLNDTDIIGLKERRKALREQRTVITRAKKYLKTTKNADGTVNIDFNYEKLNEDRLNGKITADMAEAIEKYKDSIEEANNNLNEQRQALIEGVTEYYNTLKDLREQWADYEDQLIKITEENNKKELDQLKTLSDSVKQSLDDLLNDVKRKLDERRKQEDNANTERDISQKQQRLAMLRADTSGGHQVEIAQLEKEIAEAQQNYQRSLEDQLLEKLQNQADEAAKQRERQIELQEKIATSVNNIALVDMWMANPEQYREEIIQAYKNAQNYDEQGIHRQGVIDTDAEAFFNNVRTNQDKQKETLDAIDQSKNILTQIEEDLKWIGVTVENARDRKLNVKDVHEKLGSSYKSLKTKGGYTVEDFFEANVEAKDARKAGFNLQELKDVGYNAQQLQSAGYTAKELKDVGFTMQDLKDVYTPSELKSAGFELKDFEAEKFDYSSVRDAGFTVNKLRESEIYGEQAEEDYKKIQKKYNNFLITRGAKTKKEAEKAGSSKFWGKLTSNGYNTMIAWGKQLGLTESQVATDLAKTDKLTWKDVIKAAKGAKRGGKRIKQWYPNAKKTSSFYKAFESVFGAGSWKKYASGGLATQTGPAWLDGTPSKPELVLSATDTKNFLALKDVLAGAMKGMSNTSNTYGDILYEININVDKIEKDYDVDRVVEKVKKEITKGAGYRNVTQVRNFR